MVAFLRHDYARLALSASIAFSNAPNNERARAHTHTHIHTYTHTRTRKDTHTHPYAPAPDCRPALPMYAHE